MSLPQKALDLLRTADEAKGLVDSANDTMRHSQDALAEAQRQFDQDRAAANEALSEQVKKFNEANAYIRSYFEGTLPVQPTTARPAPTPRPNQPSQGR